MQLLTQSTRVALGDCREEVEGSFSDFKVEEFSLNPTPDAIAKINANFEVLRSLGIGVVTVLSIARRPSFGYRHAPT